MRMLELPLHLSILLEIWCYLNNRNHTSLCNGAKVTVSETKSRFVTKKKILNGAGSLFFFLRVKVMMVDDVMLSKTASGLSGIRKIGAAKQYANMQYATICHISHTICI